MAWTYISKEKVSNLYNVDTSDLRDEWSDWVEALISDHLGYAYIGTTETITDEEHSGDGTPSLYVKYPPIVSVTEVKVGTTSKTTITSTSYKVFDDHIELINSKKTNIAQALDGPTTVFPVGVKNVSISYVSGLASVPKTVEFTAGLMIAEIAKYNQRGGADASIKFVPATFTRGEGEAVVAQRGLAATLQSIMRHNLRKRVHALG